MVIRDGYSKRFLPHWLECQEYQPRTVVCAPASISFRPPWLTNLQSHASSATT